MKPTEQAIRNQEILKTEYPEKAAIGALYDELSKGIKSLKKSDVYTINRLFQTLQYTFNLLFRGGFYSGQTLAQPH